MTSEDIKHRLIITETVGLLGTGAQDGHLDFHTALELWTYATMLLYVHRSEFAY